MAEVSIIGLVPTAPSPGLATEVVFLSPSQIPRAEFTQVDLFRGPLPIPASENPNDNDIILIVSTTNSALVFRVSLVPAPIPLSDGTSIQLPPVLDDLRLFAGVNAPSGICGMTIVFTTPTGGGPLQQVSPIRGMTGTIQSVGPLNEITLINGLPFVPTVGDRAVVISSDRALRRTPLLEIILE